MTQSAEPSPSEAAPLGFQLAVGTVLAARQNPKARVPALVLTIDFGPIGRRESSAQLTQNYRPEDLVGTQVVAAFHLGPKRVAGVVSEVLVLGALDGELGTILLRPDRPVAPGSRVA